MALGARTRRISRSIASSTRNAPKEMQPPWHLLLGRLTSESGSVCHEAGAQTPRPWRGSIERKA